MKPARSPIKRSHILLPFVAIALGAGGLDARAQDVMATSSGPWNSKDRWSSLQSPEPACAYRNNGGFRLDILHVSREAFDGITLTIEGPKSMLRMFRTSGVLVDLVLTAGGRLSATNTGSGQNIGGSLVIPDTGIIEGPGAAANKLTINSLVSGEGVLTLAMDGDDEFTVTNPANTFEGEWRVEGNKPGSTFRSTEAGSLGTGSTIHIVQGTFDPAYEIAGGGNRLIMTPEAVVLLHDHHHTFKSVTVGDQTLAPGTYSLDALNALGGGRFEGGTGSIAVAP